MITLNGSIDSKGSYVPKAKGKCRKSLERGVWNKGSTKINRPNFIGNLKSSYTTINIKKKMELKIRFKTFINT